MKSFGDAHRENAMPILAVRLAVSTTVGDVCNVDMVHSSQGDSHLRYVIGLR